MISNGLRNKIFAVLKEKKLLEEDARRALIYDLTKGRTDSLKEITPAEGVQLIHLLAPQDDHTKGQSMRRKLIGMFRSMGCEKSGPKGKVADMVKINDWCIRYGYLHKPLNAYRYAELPKLVSQVEQVKNGSILKK